MKNENLISVKDYINKQDNNTENREIILKVISFFLNNDIFVINFKKLKNYESWDTSDLKKELKIINWNRPYTRKMLQKAIGLDSNSCSYWEKVLNS